MTEEWGDYVEMPLARIKEMTIREDRPIFCLLSKDKS